MISRKISQFPINNQGNGSCFIVCLKMLYILKEKHVSIDPQHIINQMNICLENMSKNISELEKQDREIYYKVIKNLIRNIH